jgi:membrane fusion protein, multidrug efflux system
MSSSKQSHSHFGWVGSILLIIAVLAVGGVLAAWKYSSIQEGIAASANHPEPMESITVATAEARQHRRMTTSIGTVHALRSVALKNELPGTVVEVNLPSGQVAETGNVLVKLDVSVEEAELKSQEAEAALAQTILTRVERAGQNNAVSQIEIDRARAQHDVAVAQIARIQAIINRKTIAAPFRARIGLSDVHVGQYLAEGTELTTLQGVEDPPAVHVDFTVTQNVAAGLREGDVVEILSKPGGEAVDAKVVAIDSRVNQNTRNAMIRALLQSADASLAAPGASVRVRVPMGLSLNAVSVPVSAVRKGPGGDHVFVVAPDEKGQLRAQLRPVRSGTMIADEILVFAGLTAGEQVAASGSFKLRDGLLVAASHQSPTAPSSTPAAH